ncbi:MAG: GAF domain-containing protein [Chloroflexi bacterium]|nr:MAG: GAF domain-containing protein [Chloroflexota bacterium]
MTSAVEPTIDVQTRLRYLEDQVARLERMVRVSRMLSSTLDLEPLLQRIINIATDLVGTEAASILLEDERTGGLYFAAATGSEREELRRIQVPIEGSIAGTIFRTGQPLIIQDVHRDPRHYRGVDQSTHFETRAILGVPMRFKGRCIGVLEAVNKLGNTPFTQDDIHILSTLASQAAVAIENARLVGALQEANARLAELDRLKSDFISIASHELRTPLSLILGYATFLKEQSTGAFQEQLEMVLKGALQLQGLIEAMVNLRYLEAGIARLELSDVILQELVEEVCAEWRPMAEAQGLHLRQRVPKKPVRVRADRAKIALVLSNLLNNAVKFTPPGGRIEVTIRPQTGMVALSVADTGIGIPRDELDRIFDRFYQVESHLTRHHGGMGLGLSIAKGLVELHQGRIWAESVEGRGSRFTFTLPVSWEEAVQAREGK